MEKEFAVIFKTKRQLPMPHSYGETSVKLVDIVSKLPGFLRIESVADVDGNGISVSYWRSLDAIQAWKENATHLKAQQRGKNEWYLDYKVEICEVLSKYAKKSKVAKARNIKKNADTVLRILGSQN